jgi:ABC-type polar amino acid transport system ATPase subunit
MIDLVDIHKRFGQTEVLRGISLTVLESFDQGRIRVDDLELTATGPRDRVVAQIRQRVGMVFQQFNLFPHRTVLENVTEAPQYVLRIAREQAEAEGRELLCRVGLEDKLHARPSTLSGGQQQRVAIARALAMKPQVILFDEPTSSLDPRMTAEVTSVMTDLARSGQTMIVVTHALGFARSVAHTVHVMHEGRLAESGPPAQIFERPAQEVTREFFAQASDATGVDLDRGSH